MRFTVWFAKWLNSAVTVYIFIVCDLSHFTESISLVILYIFIGRHHVGWYTALSILPFHGLSLSHTLSMIHLSVSSAARLIWVSYSLFSHFCDILTLAVLPKHWRLGLNDNDNNLSFQFLQFCSASIPIQCPSSSYVYSCGMECIFRCFEWSFSWVSPDQFSWWRSIEIRA